MEGVLDAGESERFDCPGCNSEFEVIYEPKAVGKPKEAKGMGSATVTYCPFCGTKIDPEDLDDDDEDEDDEDD